MVSVRREHDPRLGQVGRLQRGEAPIPRWLRHPRLLLTRQGRCRPRTACAPPDRSAAAEGRDATKRRGNGRWHQRGMCWSVATRGWEARPSAKGLTKVRGTEKRAGLFACRCGTEETHGSRLAAVHTAKCTHLGVNRKRVARHGSGVRRGERDAAGAVGQEISRSRGKKNGPH